MPARIAKVLFPVNIKTEFDYRVPHALNAGVGQYVFAPLGKQVKMGVVWGIENETDSTRKLKDIADTIPTRPLSPALMQFIDWVARYNCAPKGMVLRMVLRNPKALSPSATQTVYSPAVDPNVRLTPARQTILNRGGPFPASAADIATRAEVNASTVRSFAGVGGLIAKQRPVDAPFDPLNPDLPGLELTQGQAAAARDLISNVQTGAFNVSLLDGVTGSGKTEVYLEAVAEALRRGEQALVLVPEIALTQAGLARFEKRFGAEPAQWHSAMGEAARRRTYREVMQGRAKLVIGARSALFLPFPDLRLIVVDEEHDNSYKQEEGVIYNARDMAVVRAHIEGGSVILASATPSLESLNNARTGRYAHVILPERPGSVTMPDIHLVDLKNNKPDKGDYLSPIFIAAITDRLVRGEQSLLYLNRRGFAPQIICRVCGEKLRSPDTDSWLVEHRASGRAVCHQTGFSMRMPKQCPTCHADGGLVGVGPGVERVAEEASRHFPSARIEVLSSDTAGNPTALHERMARMTSGEIDILVGTQMVVKGHNFPKLTFVGVVDGDLSLAGGDLRAGERTYQTLVQVAGRAGRADRPGQAMIQTHQPEHEALSALAAGDRDLFLSAEIATRDMLGLPPFGRLAAVIISHPNPNRADQLSREFRDCAPHTTGVDIMGPSEPPLARLRGLYRRRLLIRAEPHVNLSAYMSQWRERIKLPSKSKLHIDMDPQSFF